MLDAALDFISLCVRWSERSKQFTATIRWQRQRIVAVIEYIALRRINPFVNSFISSFSTQLWRAELMPIYGWSMLGLI